MDEESKIKHSKRRHQKETHVKRETAIAKSHNIPTDTPHKFAKQSPMSCGNPKCVMCANPRKVWEELTIQEKKHFQDIDTQRDRHSNGILAGGDIHAGDGGYNLSTHEKQAEFAKKRNYHITNTDNPIDFP